MNFPDFYQLVPTVRTYDSFAAVLGAARDGVLEYHYADAVRLAGHSCPTVAGAFLMGRAALSALYPDRLAERGNIAVRMPAPEDEGTTGVIAQILTLLTGAAPTMGFRASADDSDVKDCLPSLHSMMVMPLFLNVSIITLA